MATRLLVVCDRNSTLKMRWLSHSLPWRRMSSRGHAYAALYTHTSRAVGPVDAAVVLSRPMEFGPTSLPLALTAEACSAERFIVPSRKLSLADMNASACGLR
ncbi:hypothetical protein BAUCODRAFT_33722 [Baudoinia panamericana UAMH 10762]|uniref:Uncharacterized protein n=1 Tax=Baudoinia panamericana (strain UAMH 10762) TaxID=717646 RepID=M2NBX8_BAUPA|nr:uncharacterized protein BAUCODRAFT_33722 [Baudoinia panamericana UAMH 10762]EMC96395.1 hypothetical protein BAUCODRAFT_33722 [Baudoinia panamericana UAMH 10762]